MVIEDGFGVGVKDDGFSGSQRWDTDLEMWIWFERGFWKIFLRMMI